MSDSSAPNPPNPDSVDSASTPIDRASTPANPDGSGMGLPPQAIPVHSVEGAVEAALRLRASDADRDRVATVLNNAYAEGRLTPVEHDERLAEVYAATTYADLIPTMRDLPVPPGTLTVPNTAAPVTVPQPVPSEGSGSTIKVQPGLPLDTSTTAAAVFGEFNRKGPWTVPDEMSAVTVFGSGELDFSEATLTSNETVITVVAIFGEIKMTVPSGIGVRNEVVV